MISELPKMVYYQAEGGVAVNLYTPSTAEVDLGENLSLRISQETEYPSGEQVTIHLVPSRPAEFPVHLRIDRRRRS